MKVQVGVFNQALIAIVKTDGSFAALVRSARISMPSIQYLITGALLEYAAILMILKTRCIPLRKLERITNGQKKESMVMTAHSLERQRKSIINGTFERTSDLEVSMIRLDTQLYP